MNISLSPMLDSYIKERVESGLYNSASEVVREALRLLQKRDDIYEQKIQALREDIRQGLNSGEAADFDVEEFLSELDQPKGR